MRLLLRFGLLRRDHARDELLWVEFDALFLMFRAFFSLSKPMRKQVHDDRPTLRFFVGTPRLHFRVNTCGYIVEEDNFMVKLQYKATFTCFGLCGERSYF